MGAGAVRKGDLPEEGGLRALIADVRGPRGEVMAKAEELRERLMPPLDALRSAARFQALLRRMNFPTRSLPGL